VVPVPVGCHYEIQLAQIHVQRFNIMLKNLSIPASVEKYALTAKLDQRGESQALVIAAEFPNAS
jgi:hypothetical protein